MKMEYYKLETKQHILVLFLAIDWQWLVQSGPIKCDKIFEFIDGKATTRIWRHHSAIRYEFFDFCLFGVNWLNFNPIDTNRRLLLLPDSVCQNMLIS